MRINIDIRMCCLGFFRIVADKYSLQSLTIDIHIRLRSLISMSFNIYLHNEKLSACGCNMGAFLTVCFGELDYDFPD